MSELVEFDDLNQIKTLLRAGVDLKFESADDDNVLNGSTIYAAALHRCRDALIDGLRSDGALGLAQQHADWYQLSRHDSRWKILARRAVSYSGWRELSEEKRRELIETLAAPFVVDEESLAAVTALCEEISEQG